MSEDVKTLEHLIYAVRDTVGDVKDNLLARLGAIQGPTVLGDFIVRTYLGSGSYLTDQQGKICRYLSEIENNRLLLGVENKQLKQKTVDLISEMGHLVGTMPFGMTFQELTKLSSHAKELYETLKPIAEESREIDSLTQLRLSTSLKSNLLDILHSYINKPSHNISLCMIDLNDFKRYNDGVGRDQADILISQTARILKETVEGSIFRSTGAGDEFYVCLDGADVDGAKIAMKRFSTALEQKAASYTQEACDRELVGGYTAKFHDKKQTASTGITSTHIPDCPDLFKRVYDSIISSNHSDIKSALKFALELPPEERYKINLKINPAKKEALLKVFRATLFNELENAMHLSKNKGKEISNVSVFDAKLSAENYEYHSTRTD